MHDPVSYSDRDTRPVALTIAGSDSGGGAGIQADLRVFHRLGTFGTSAITAVTAQNLAGVTHVVGLDSATVRAQIDAVLAGFSVCAVKTGMLWSCELVATVADVARILSERGIPVVVDPVMVATSGARLLDDAAIEFYRARLLPCAALVTPNLDEAAVLLGCSAIARDQLEQASDQLFARFGCPVLLKGGHLDDARELVDMLRHPGGRITWTHARLTDVDTHGTGCMLSAAIAARLAHGDSLARACRSGLAFVHDALARPLALSPAIALAGIENAEPDASAIQEHITAIADNE